MDYLDRIPDEEEQDELTGMLRALANAREKVADAKAATRRLLEDFQTSPEYTKLNFELEVAGNVEKMYDEEIRKYAIKHPEHLPKEVVVKTFKVAVIENPEEARLWCFENFRPALKLDENALKGAIKENLVPMRVGRVVEEKRAQISTNLSKYSE